jgi:hypothetical protein
MTSRSPVLSFPTSTPSPRSTVLTHPGSFNSVLDMMQHPRWITRLNPQVEDCMDHIHASRIKILSIGDDEDLLNTRQMVLESAGFRVQSIAGTGTIEEAGVQVIDLALICHTIPAEQAFTTARFLKRINPAITILHLCNACGGRPSNPGRIASYGPQQFLTKVNKALQDKLNRDMSAILATQADLAT